MTAPALWFESAPSRRGHTGLAMALSLMVHAVISGWLVFFAPATPEREPIAEIELLAPADLLPEAAPAPAVTASRPRGAAPAAAGVQPAAPERVASHPAPVSKPVAAPPPSGTRGRARAAEVAGAVAAGNLLDEIDAVMAGGGRAPAGAANAAGDEAAALRAGAATLAAGAGRESGAAGIAAAAASANHGLSSGGLARAAVAIEEVALGGGSGTAIGADDEAAGSGDRTSASLMAVVHRYAGGIKYCYDRSLETRPDIAGRIVLLITVAPTGAVSRVQTVANTVKDPELEACVLGQVKAWKFPASAGTPVTFRCPLVFTPPAE
jgi:outer membrane biosynthesis protein TonB